MKSLLVPLAFIVLVASSTFAINVSNCSVLSSPGTYSLTTDLTGAPFIVPAIPAWNDHVTCIDINVSDVILDCGGHNITSNLPFGSTDLSFNTTSGIVLNGVLGSVQNVTVRNCRLSGYDRAVYLRESNYSDLYNNSVTNSSVSAFFLDYSHNNTLYNNTASASNYSGFQLSISVNNLFSNNIAYNNSHDGFYLYSSAYNTLFNNTAYNNSYYGFNFLLEDEPGPVNVSNNIAYGNFIHGFYFYYPRDSVIANNVAYNNSDSGFYLHYTVNNSLTGNSGYNNTLYGFYFNHAFNNTVIGNSAYNNMLYGLYFTSDSSNNILMGNSVFMNLLGGAYVLQSTLTNLTSEHYYNNTDDFSVSSDGVPLTLSFAAAIFDNPTGNVSQFTNLSLNDDLDVSESYSMNWSSLPAALPDNYTSFSGKFLTISPAAGSSIDSLSWAWTDAEVAAGGYDEARFSLWKYNGTWLQMNATPDTVTNALALSNVSSFSTFGILVLGDTTAPAVTLNSPANGSSFSPATMTFRFTAVDDTSAILNCSVFLDGASNQTNSSVLNGTPTSFVITGIALGGHNWSVACTDDANNTGTGGTRTFSRVQEQSSSSSSPSPECAADGDCPAAEACSGGSCVAVACACGVVQDHQCVAYACCADSDCTASETCSGNSCVAVQCACGAVENHACVPYACCADSDCQANQSCASHACVDKPALPPQQNQTNMTNQTAPGNATSETGCTLGSECPTGQYCDAGSCVSQPAMSAPAEAAGGVTLTVTSASGPCAYCEITWVSPSGARGRGTTDANGGFSLPLNETGTYTFTSVKGGRSISIYSHPLAAPQQKETPLATAISDAVTGQPVWLALIVAAIACAAYIIYRGRKAG
ncbi:MAG: right-handed parallel beta-helix repeat-containing protein [Candidatus ainarchaeum sp.]|nr:right-handed parallel beta-helix repeat-containing protein [Candidatus ainarchaeum sp.]